MSPFFDSVEYATVSTSRSRYGSGFQVPLHHRFLTFLTYQGQNGARRTAELARIGARAAADER